MRVFRQGLHFLSVRDAADTRPAERFGVLNEGAFQPMGSPAATELTLGLFLTVIPTIPVDHRLRYLFVIF